MTSTVSHAHAKRMIRLARLRLQSRRDHLDWLEAFITDLEGNRDVLTEEAYLAVLAQVRELSQ